jgi:TolB-like protein
VGACADRLTRRIPAGTARRGLRLPLLALVLLAATGLGSSGCGGAGAGTPRPAAEPGRPRPRLAVLPFENLTGSTDAGDRLTRVFFSEIAQQGAYEVAEPGEVEAALEALDLRLTGTLTAAEADSLGRRLGVERILLGSVLESGTVRTDDGDLPTVGASIRLLDAGTGRVLWTRMEFLAGDDRETIFGWGRERDDGKLAQRLARQLIRQMPVPAARPPEAKEEQQP